MTGKTIIPAALNYKKTDSSHNILPVLNILCYATHEERAVLSIS